MTPLEMAPTKQLLDELANRFDHMIFAGIIERVTKEGDESIRCLRMTGCRYVDQALASSVMIKAHEENLARAEPATDEDL